MEGSKRGTLPASPTPQKKMHTTLSLSATQVEAKAQAAGVDRFYLNRISEAVHELTVPTIVRDSGWAALSIASVKFTAPQNFPLPGSKVTFTRNDGAKFSLSLRRRDWTLNRLAN